MDGFFQTPYTRPYADMWQGPNDAGASQDSQTEKDGISGFAGTVQDKLDGNRNDNRRTDSARKKKEKSFWEKRTERHKLYMDLTQKAWYKRENERRFQERINPRPKTGK